MKFYRNYISKKKHTKEYWDKRKLLKLIKEKLHRDIKF